VRGDLEKCQDQAHRECVRFRDSSPELAWRFRVLEAESLLWQGMYPQALTTLDSQPIQPSSKDSLVEVFAIEGAALGRLHRFPEAEEKLAQATQFCHDSPQITCGDVTRARGLLALQRGQPDAAKQFFEQSLQFAYSYKDPFLEATSLLNLGLISLREQHFDEAIDLTDSAYRRSTILGSDGVAQGALGNLGWAYYYLGDTERSLKFSLEAAALASRTGNVTAQLTWLTAAGYVYASRGNLAGAKQSYREALDLANKTRGPEAIHDAYRALALVSVENGELDEAREYSDKTFEMAHADKDRLGELYSLLVKGLIAAQLHDATEADRIFREVEEDRETNASLKVRAQYARARLYEDQGRTAAAGREYQAALKTIEASRSTLKHEESKLPFSNNARHVYDDYIHFLVATKKTDDALRWADFSRARTLAEGLGLLANGAATGPPPLKPQQLAQQAKATIFFYWLGERQSYLWAITPRKTALFALPPGSQIDAAVQRYRQALAGPQDVLASADPDGQSLYRMLIEPAQSLLKKQAKVLLIPDGSLNNLNFETLLVPEAKPPETNPSRPNLHYWIEDVTVADASSLRVLGASPRGHAGRNASTGIKGKRDRSLLLIGNSVAPNNEYPELSKAAIQMDDVARRFSASEEKILTREAATPKAYLNSHPEKFSYIHFTAHGKSSRLSPLDSMIVLSKDSGQDDSFKLYARDIISYHEQNPLRAELVTVSACYSAGERSYYGEGLVGLSWAFLRAGARNVIAALWDASDASTEQLMDKFYEELEKGAAPDAALHAAKLSLLHNRDFQNPFYWAPFQLYARLE
jgi:CHAT domain-containing protein/Flp pilus assembly protein TadD